MIPCLSATLINILPARGSRCPQGRSGMEKKQSPSSSGGACVFGGKVVNGDRGSVCSCFNSTRISTVKSGAVIVPRQHRREARAEPQNIKFFHPTSLLSISSRPAPPATLADKGHLQQPRPRVSILVLPSTPRVLPETWASPGQIVGAIRGHCPGENGSRMRVARVFVEPDLESISWSVWIQRFALQFSVCLRREWHQCCPAPQFPSPAD